MAYRTTMPGLDDQTKVRRECTAIAGSRSLFVRIRRRKIIRELAWTLEHLPLVVRTVRVLDLLRHRARLVDGVGYADEVTPGDTVERVARRTHLAVYLIPPADAARVFVRVSVCGSDMRGLTWHGQRYRASLCVARDRWADAAPRRPSSLRGPRR